MNKLICTNPKNYKLTEGNEYEIIKFEGENLFLINDNGKTVRYSRDLFAEYEEEAVQVEEVIERTEQDLINSISCVGTSVKYFNYKNEETVIPNCLGTSSPVTEFSCGVKLILHINSQIRYISQFVEEDEVLMGQDLINLIKALVEISVKNFIKRNLELGGIAGIFLISTNTNGEGALDEEFFKILDEISDFNSNEELNPNSQNNIKIWGFYKSNL